MQWEGLLLFRRKRRPNGGDGDAFYKPVLDESRRLPEVVNARDSMGGTVDVLIQVDVDYGRKAVEYIVYEVDR